MPQWYVELIWEEPLSHDSRLLSLMATSLQEKECTITARDGKYYLLSSDFDSLASDFEVRSCAKRLLPLINSIARLKFHKYFKQIEIGDAYRVDSNGQLVRDSAAVEATGHFYPYESVLRAANMKQPDVAEIWRVIQKYPEVKEAMRFYAKRFDWNNLRKIYEAVRHDVTRSTFDTWTQGWNDNFWESANNARLSGEDALHCLPGSHVVPRGITSMTLNEAAERITDLLMEWISTKP